MKDLTDPRWIKIKGVLFLFLGCFASTILLLEHPNLHDAALLALAIWAFCRAYYFAFYVIEHYVDPKFHFSGLCSFAGYWIGRLPEKGARSSAAEELGTAHSDQRD